LSKHKQENNCEYTKTTMPCRSDVVYYLPATTEGAITDGATIAARSLANPEAVHLFQVGDSSCQVYYKGQLYPFITVKVSNYWKFMNKDEEELIGFCTSDRRVTCYPPGDGTLSHIQDVNIEISPETEPSILTMDDCWECFKILISRGEVFSIVIDVSSELPRKLIDGCTAKIFKVMAEVQDAIGNYSVEARAELENEAEFILTAVPQPVGKLDPTVKKHLCEFLYLTVHDVTTLDVLRDFQSIRVKSTLRYVQMGGNVPTWYGSIINKTPSQDSIAMLNAYTPKVLPLTIDFFNTGHGTTLERLYLEQCLLHERRTWRNTMPELTTTMGRVYRETQRLYTLYESRATSPPHAWDDRMRYTYDSTRMALAKRSSLLPLIVDRDERNRIRWLFGLYTPLNFEGTPESFRQAELLSWFQEDRIMALMLGTHGRAGANSIVRFLPNEILRRIFTQFFHS
jgi:hypothetical protein